MGQPTRPWRRALLGALAILTLAAPSCGDEPPAPPSAVTTLRVLSVTADTPYATPGDTVALRMTFHDALGAAEGPRPVQITWLGGCWNPIGESYIACYPQLLGVLKEVFSGGIGAEGLARQDVATPDQSGAPDAAAFDLALPEDILTRGPETGEPRAYATAYVFFTACAGEVRPNTKPEASFPLECVGEDGAVLGPDSFIAGYTQIYVFADGRTNANPPIQGLTLDDTAIEDGVDNAPVVERCTDPPDPMASGGGCGRPPETGGGCKTYTIKALVDDVAEVDPSAFASDGTPLREAIWVNYFADKGEFDRSIKLISDPANGYNEDHGVTFIPPAEPGLVTMWAVAHDARGGASVTRRFVRVE
jgi:hypothetical protein